jgi:DNA polymerase zeta
MTNMKLDPRAEPQYGDRVPYVIVARGPNVKLRDKPMSPLTYMADRYVILSIADKVLVIT